MKAKRYRVGDEIGITNGQGQAVQARITNLEPFEFETLAELVPEVAPSIVLVLALVKGERFEQAVQIAVELGVSGVIPWQSNRSIVKFDAKKRGKEQEKLRQLVISSSKQARRAFFPKVHDVQTTKQLMKSLHPDANFLDITPHQRILLYENAFEQGAPSLQQVAQSSASEGGAPSAIIVIGPEGGIAPEEVDQFKGLGFKLAHLGKLILRTPTAVAKALSILS